MRRKKKKRVEGERREVSPLSRQILVLSLTLVVGYLCKVGKANRSLRLTALQTCKGLGMTNMSMQVVATPDFR
jgi:hypothetical protein